MANRLAIGTAPVVLLLALAACSEGGSPAPKSPPPITQTIGVITGTVVGNQMTATYTPMGAQAAAYGASPTIYGDPTKARVTGFFLNTVDVVGPPGVGSRTWTFSVSIHNLMAATQGSNYAGAAALDSTGLFLGFTQLPTVTLPSPCASCAVNVVGTMGTANFTAPNQPYYWYPNRVQAAGTAGGKDSTPGVTWTFKTNSWNPGVTDTVHAFTFQLYVNAIWPAPGQTQWSVSYNGTADSAPESQAEPRWTRFTSTNSATLGVESWSPAGLVASATNNTRSVYFGRRDSLGTNSAVMDATVKVANVAAGVPQAAFGFAEPGTGRQMFVVIASDRVGFGNFAQNSGNWTFQGGLFYEYFLDATQAHSYRLRKIGTTSVALCVDGTQRVTRTYGQQQQTRLSFAQSSTVFGVDGNAGNSSSTWTAVSWTIGSDGGGC